MEAELESRVARLLEHEKLVVTNDGINYNDVNGGEDDKDLRVSASTAKRRTRQLSRDVERLTRVLARRTASHEFEVSRFRRRLEGEEERMMSMNHNNNDSFYEYVQWQVLRLKRLVAWCLFSRRGLKLLVVLGMTAMFARRLLFLRGSSRRRR